MRYDENLSSEGHNVGGNEYEYETEMAGTLWNVDSIWNSGCYTMAFYYRAKYTDLPDCIVIGMSHCFV